MDFTAFEVETEKPVFVQFASPFTGELLFEQMDELTDSPQEERGRKVNNPDKPVGVMLYGQDSKKFTDRQRELRDKVILEAKKSRNPQNVQIKNEDLAQSNRDTVKACIDSFVNVTWEGEDLGTRRDQYDAFFLKHPWAFNLCNAAVMDRANFQKASQKN